MDANGHVALPGAIDTHVHFREPGFEHKETWASGTTAAAAGGVTMVVDQPNTDPTTTTGTAYDRKRDCAATARVDYGINGGVTQSWEPATLFDRPLFALGEVFLADSTGALGIDLETFETAIAEAARAEVPVTVHAKDATQFDPDAIDGIPAAVGTDVPVDRWSQYRPPAAEVAAVEAALSIADAYDVTLHFAHISTPEAVDAIAPTDATCEVTPHHLFLSRTDGDRLGTYGRMNPPLRSSQRQAALFDRVRSGAVDIVATDHAPHRREEKEQSLTAAPSGVPGVQTMLPLLLSAVRSDRLSLSTVRDLTATRPASIFGLESKGTLRPGADADIVLFDPARIRPVNELPLKSRADWTPFSDHRVVPTVATFSRGRPVFADERAPLAAELPPQTTASAGQNVRA